MMTFQGLKTGACVLCRNPKKNQMIFLDGGLPDGATLAYIAGGKEVLKGIKQGCGILCSHCKIEISPSEFKKHAGYEFRRKPYENIFILNGPVIRLSLSKYTKKLEAVKDMRT